MPSIKGGSNILEIGRKPQDPARKLCKLTGSSGELLQLRLTVKIQSLHPDSIAEARLHRIYLTAPGFV